MWQVNKIENGWEVRHTNGKKATCVVFALERRAQDNADHYNKIGLGFCPTCGQPQIKNWICHGCAAETLANNPEILNGRMANCAYHSNPQKPSKEAREKEGFFEYRPNHETDSYYCGCRGFD